VLEGALEGALGVCWRRDGGEFEGTLRVVGYLRVVG
jgi:hypothetical protein